MSRLSSILALSRRKHTTLRCVAAALIIIFIVGCLTAIKRLSLEETRTEEDFKRNHVILQLPVKEIGVKEANRINTAQRTPLSDTIKEPAMVDSKHAANASTDLPNYNVHVFYYIWYGNPEFDGQYLHWNHNRLPHWDKKIARKFPKGQHVPPEDIGADYYPELGCYSSRDAVVVDNHMRQIRSAGIGVVVISWYPSNRADEAGFPSDDIIPMVLDTCNRYNIKVAFHSEPYKNRTELTFLEDLKYIIGMYGSHPAFYKHTHNGKSLPMVYLYDSYLTPARNWARILSKGMPLSIRGTPHDAHVIGLYVDLQNSISLLQGRFDGFYTYFASNQFTYASCWTNWKHLAGIASRNGMIFIPSVGPGYIDTTIRPWNSVNTKERLHGAYYTQAFEAAINCTPSVISITSFNEWHEGTQIESAVPKVSGINKYRDYEPKGPGYYLELTNTLVHKYAKL